MTAVLQLEMVRHVNGISTSRGTHQSGSSRSLAFRNITKRCPMGMPRQSAAPTIRPSDAGSQRTKATGGAVTDDNKCKQTLECHCVDSAQINCCDRPA